jgi:rubrerythrin
MEEYFKDKAPENAKKEDIEIVEKKKQGLRNMITGATAERTTTILNHFEEIAENVRLQIDEIDRLLGTVKKENDIPDFDIDTVKDELIQNMDNLKKQLGEYDEQHPLFHYNLQNYQKITKEIQDYINKLKQKESINDEEGKNWEIKKNILLDELVNLERSIENNLTDADVSKIPPALN